MNLTEKIEELEKEAKWRVWLLDWGYHAETAKELGEIEGKIKQLKRKQRFRDLLDDDAA